MLITKFSERSWVPFSVNVNHPVYFVHFNDFVLYFSKYLQIYDPVTLCKGSEFSCSYSLQRVTIKEFTSLCKERIRILLNTLFFNPTYQLEAWTYFVDFYVFLLHFSYWEFGMPSRKQELLVLAWYTISQKLMNHMNMTWSKQASILFLSTLLSNMFTSTLDALLYRI